MNKDIKVIESRRNGNILIEILEYENLKGAGSPAMAERLYFSQKSGIRLRQVRITLMGGRDSEITTEAGSLQYLKGKIKQDNSVGGLGGFTKRMIQNKLNDEDIFRPTYKGEGVIYLEPSFKHFTLIDMDDSEIILDRGMFYCCSSGIELGVRSVGSVSAAVLGSDGLFQTSIKGTGVAVVEIPVHADELVMLELEGDGDVVQVDGDSCLMRSGSVSYSVKKFNKSIFKTATSGDIFLETFTGTGYVWVAPTKSSYDMFWKGKENISDNLVNSIDLVEDTELELVDSFEDNSNEKYNWILIK